MSLADERRVEAAEKLSSLAQFRIEKAFAGLEEAINFIEEGELHTQDVIKTLEPLVNKSFTKDAEINALPYHIIEKARDVVDGEEGTKGIRDILGSLKRISTLLKQYEELAKMVWDFKHQYEHYLDNEPDSSDDDDDETEYLNNAEFLDEINKGK